MRDAASHYPLSQSECVSLFSTPLITCIDRCPSPHNTTAHTSAASFMESSAFPGCGDAAVETQYDIISAQIDYAWAECRVKGNWWGEREREMVRAEDGRVQYLIGAYFIVWSTSLKNHSNRRKMPFIDHTIFKKNSEMKEVTIWRKQHKHHSFFNKVLFCLIFFWQIP